MVKKGVFLVIEGLDGSGKTTQAALLAEKLSEKYTVLLTAEPSRGKIGSFIRDSCLYEQTRLPTEAEALLFAADRIEHMQTELKPALDAGKLVICDRYALSTVVYQSMQARAAGCAGRVAYGRLVDLHHASWFLTPDLTILLRPPIGDEGTLRERVTRRRGAEHAFETDSFLREQNVCYWAADYAPRLLLGSIAYVDATGTPGKVLEDAIRAIAQHRP